MFLLHTQVTIFEKSSFLFASRTIDHFLKTCSHLFFWFALSWIKRLNIIIEFVGHASSFVLVLLFLSEVAIYLLSPHLRYVHGNRKRNFLLTCCCCCCFFSDVLVLWWRCLSTLGLSVGRWVYIVLVGMVVEKDFFTLRMKRK